MKLAANRFVAESYFEFHSDKASTGSIGTSKKLFSKYPGRPTAAQLAASLHGPMPNCMVAEAIEDKLETVLFPQWLQQLRLGINVALYGYGSKGHLLSRLVPVLREEAYHVFWVKTFDTSTSAGTSGGASNLLQTVQTILKNIFPYSDRLGRNLREAIDILSAHLGREADVKIILIVEMVDTPSWRSEDTWASLRRLAQLQNLCLVLTFEHVNAALLGNDRSWATLSLAWHNVTSLRPYGSELSALQSVGSQGVDGSESKCQGAKFVLSSLTQTARSVYRVLLEYQMSITSDRAEEASDGDEEPSGDAKEHGESHSEVIGLSMVTWYQRCQEQFLVSNEIAFRTQLAEFIDHELVRATDGLGQYGNFFAAPFERTHLAELANFLAINGNDGEDAA